VSQTVPRLALTLTVNAVSTGVREMAHLWRSDLIVCVEQKHAASKTDVRWKTCRIRHNSCSASIRALSIQTNPSGLPVFPSSTFA